MDELYNIRQLGEIVSGKRVEYDIKKYVKSATRLYIEGNKSLEKLLLLPLDLIPSFNYEGLNITPCPTITNKLMRYIKLDNSMDIFLRRKTIHTFIVSLIQENYRTIILRTH